MTQVVLHIGMHKTGSTAIQKRLEANAELLDRHGISFDDDSKNQLKSAAKSGISSSGARSFVRPESATTARC